MLVQKRYDSGCNRDGESRTMFGIHKKLRGWVAAGLIGPEQQAAITAFEKSRQQGRFGRGITGLALFAIIIGVLSLIAANWVSIPASFKIIVHLLINIALAITVWRAQMRGQDNLREGALLVLGGLTLTFIALIGQVFQLGGSYAGALLVWQMAMIPAFLVYGQTRLTAVPGVLAFTGCVPVIVMEWTDKIPDFWSMFTGVAVLTALPLLYVAIGSMERCRATRPVWCDTALRIGFVILVLSASLASLLWYEDRSDEFSAVFDRAGIAVSSGMWILSVPTIIAVFALFGHWAFFRSRAVDPQFYVRTWGLVLTSIVMLGLPMLIPNGSSDMLAMGSFLIYWGFLGWYAHATGAVRLLSLAITVLAIRIWIIYLEAFGGLAMTGFGLIFGGVFMLAMIYGARRLNRRLGNSARTQHAGKV
jgi:uncharacterized membrane protein